MAFVLTIFTVFKDSDTVGKCFLLPVFCFAKIHHFKEGELLIV